MHEREVGAVLAGTERHPQRVEDQVGAHVAGELPTDDAAGERVQHEAEEHGPFPAAQIREVRDPQRIRLLSGEHAVHEIWPTLDAGVGCGGPPRLPAPFRALKAFLAHQPRNLITTGVHAVALQRLVHPPIPIGPIVGLMHAADPPDQPLVALNACGALPGRPLVVRGRRDAQRPACRLDPVAIAHLIDERAHDGRFGSSSCAKNTLASFRIVFARRSSKFSRRSRLSSSFSLVVSPSR